MRVLALIPGDIGNQLLFFPTLETLKQQYPQATLDVLVEPRAKKAYRVCKNVDDVLVFDFQDRNSFADYLNLLGTVRDREYDVLITLKTSWRIKLLLWLNGIPARIGYRDDSAIYLSTAVPRKAKQYTAEMYHDLLTGLNINSPCPPIKIAVPTADISWAEAEQQRLGVGERGYIILCDEPSADEVSAYPVSSWQKIIEDIEKRQTGLTIILLQTERNRAWVATMISANVNLRGVAPGDVGKTAAIIAGANLMLCNNAAPTQFAIATGTYTFALSTPQTRTLVPSNSESCTAIVSATDSLADIAPKTALELLWQE